MDLQNVANWTIPEGEVMSLHDKDNRLLWSAVGYSVKYEGNTTQGASPTPDYPQAIAVVTGAQTVKVTGKNLWSLTSSYTNSATTNSWVLPDTNMAIPSGNYVFSCETANTNNVQFSWKYADNVSHSSIFTNGKTSVTFAEDVIKIAIRMQGPNSISNIQLERGSTATTYEPYQSQSYTVNLGATELCKIGDYQDYIYKSNGDWYTHKATTKKVLNGAESGWTATGNPIVIYLSNPTPDFAKSGNTPVSNYFTGAPNYVSGGIPANTICFTSNQSSKRFYVKYQTIFTDLTDFKTWLSQNTPTVYYALATPTDTQITDNTLIGQLNNIHQWLERYGYNATVSGNLPIVIDRTNL